MLEINPYKIEVNHKRGQSRKQINLLDQKNKESQLMMMQNRTFNRILIDKETITANNKEMVDLQNTEKTKQNDTVQKEKNITVNVPQNVIETMQSKIIGAQQKVGNFMSEVARNMYLNYKPPFTAFKMNLNPANLGSIAVVMRANRTDRSVSVSMNMDNTSTANIFADNKAALQTALQKQLGDGSTVTLNFESQGGGTNEQFGQSSQNNDSQSQNNSTKPSEESTNPNIEEENTEDLDYM